MLEHRPSHSRLPRDPGRLPPACSEVHTARLPALPCCSRAGPAAMAKATQFRAQDKKRKREAKLSGEARHFPVLVAALLAPLALVLRRVILVIDFFAHA